MLIKIRNFHVTRNVCSNESLVERKRRKLKIYLIEIISFNL